MREEGWRVRLRRATGVNGAADKRGPEPRDRGRAAQRDGRGTPTHGRVAAGRTRRGGSRAESDRGLVTSPAVGYFLAREGVSVGNTASRGATSSATSTCWACARRWSPRRRHRRPFDVEPGQAVEYGQPSIASQRPAVARRRTTDVDEPVRPAGRGLMFSKILIANRGEIALRILRACRTLGIASVVAYSEADRESPAPCSWRTRRSASGPPSRGAAICRRRRCSPRRWSAGCEAIHPGYGFLSEDDTFAEMTRAHGLAFIGPPPEVLERFASKAGTRTLLAKHGLPTIPGSGMLRDDAHALAEAERIGYPVLIKPSAGGGGKGMRMVRSPRELQQAITVCRSEALAAFGDDSLYLEKWLEENRHVEVQVIVDRYGNGVHVGERDCSVQRRHQKIIEEAPSPALDDARRAGAGRAGRPRRRRCGLRERGHARVPARPGRQLLLHRDQLPHPGGASR